MTSVLNTTIIIRCAVAFNVYAPGLSLVSGLNAAICLLSLSQNAALQHLFIRKSFRPFKCSQCGKAFREKDKLEQHARYHGHDGCRHACHHCNKGFLSSAALEDHLQLHSDQRTYSCLFCTESYDRLDLLKEHVGVHLVNGCFSCPSCKKTFTDFIQVWYWGLRALMKPSPGLNLLWLHKLKWSEVKWPLIVTREHCDCVNSVEFFVFNPLTKQWAATSRKFASRQKGYLSGATICPGLWTHKPTP